MLVVPPYGLEAGEILLSVVELESGLDGHCRPPHGVRESTKPTFRAEVIVLTRLHPLLRGGGSPLSPPDNLLPPLLHNLPVSKFAPS